MWSPDRGRLRCGRGPGAHGPSGTPNPLRSARPTALSRAAPGRVGHQGATTPCHQHGNGDGCPALDLFVRHASDRPPNRCGERTPPCEPEGRWHRCTTQVCARPPSRGSQPEASGLMAGLGGAARLALWGGGRRGNGASARGAAACRHGRCHRESVESNPPGVGAGIEAGLPGMGLEPIRTCVRRFLRPLRLPLRHPGGVLLSGQGSGTRARPRLPGLTDSSLSYADQRGWQQLHPAQASPDPRLGAGLTISPIGLGAGRRRRGSRP